MVNNKAKIKDGLVVGLLWLVWSVISDWHELNTPILAKGALAGQSHEKVEEGSQGDIPSIG
jgi:hypothetical protein